MDRKKYVFEASDDVKKVIALGVTHGGAIWTDTTDIENLEELNSDYINEHFGELQQDAYDRGYKDGRNVTETQAHDDAYQRGLDDAWEAARKVGHCKLWDDYTKDTGKPSVCAVAVLDRYTAYEAIEKLKAYEEKKSDDEIKVGDEVKPFYTDITGVVTLIDGDTIYVLWRDGSSTSTMKLKEATKTGRHFDIASILEDMRND